MARAVMNHDPAVRAGVMPAELFPYRVVGMRQIYCDRSGIRDPSNARNCGGSAWSSAWAARTCRRPPRHPSHDPSFCGKLSVPTPCPWYTAKRVVGPPDRRPRVRPLRREEAVRWTITKFRRDPRRVAAGTGSWSARCLSPLALMEVTVDQTV